jgi:RNA polymerase sigma-70 factor (ECF subfamily)
MFRQAGTDTIEDTAVDAGPRCWLSPWPQPVDATLSEPDLVRAARHGDRAAFGQLFGLYGRMVHGVLIAHVPGHEVDDLVQDVFLRALRSLDGLKDDLAFGGWLAMIARNRAHDWRRRARPAAELHEDLDVAASTASPEASAAAAEALTALRSLPAAYRETLVLRLVEGMSGPEIAARTGMTHGSVRVNLHRGMQLLRDKLQWKVPHEE